MTKAIVWCRSRDLGDKGNEADMKGAVWVGGLLSLILRL